MNQSDRTLFSNFPKLSLLGKKWFVKNTSTEGSLFERILTNRGLTTEAAIESFLYPEASKHFHDPYLMKDMACAVTRISTAMKSAQRIMVFGDYDVDGITGSAILLRTFKLLKANASCRLPHRIKDGYGLRKKFIDEFKKLDVKLIITVDNGISCNDEVAYANELGIDVIISDHHTVPQKIPPAYAILHPKVADCGYPFIELTGAGVALKLAQALLQKHHADSLQHILSLLDLAAMGTIADLGELRGENRYIVKEGLRILENTRWPGLSRLKEKAGVKGSLSTRDVGFMLSPRINAAGRMASPTDALKLLISDSSDTVALADNLEKLNRERQVLMIELIEIARAKAASCKYSGAIVVSDASFHSGVIGLLAARLVEDFGKPAIVMEDRGDVLVGSCRSIAGVSVVQALTDAGKYLMKFGGHAQAAGFELAKENYNNFVDAVAKSCTAQLNGESAIPSLHIECTALHEDLTFDSIQQIQSLEPFGMGNETPRLLVENLPIHSVSTVGKEKRHLKIISEANGNPLECIAFKFGEFEKILHGKNMIDVVCELEANTWNGRSRVQLKIIDCR